MTAGAIAIEKLQAGLETVRGTAVPATRIVYPQRGGWFDQTITREFMDEDHSSYIAHYGSVVTEQKANLTFPFYLTASDIAWYGQQFLAGAVTGVLSAVTVYTYTFSPTIVSASTDNLKSATYEAYSDTQAYQLPFCLGDTLALTWTNGKIATGTATYLAQQAIPQAITGSLTDRTGLNPMAGTSVSVFIDAAGGTIGTTPAVGVTGGTITWNNSWQQITHSLGNLYPDDAARLPRALTIELDQHWTTAAEYATLKAGGERLIRVVFTGPVIAGSTGSVHETITADFYGFYLSAPFSVDNAIRRVKLTGESQYDTTATTDWKLAAATSLATLV